MAEKLTDEQVLEELIRLKSDEDVKLGRKYLYNKNKARQRMYQLRYMQKIGRTLRESGLDEEIENLIEGTE